MLKFPKEIIFSPNVTFLKVKSTPLAKSTRLLLQKVKMQIDEELLFFAEFLVGRKFFQQPKNQQQKVLFWFSIPFT